MTKKLILLMLCIPIIIMVSLFSTTQTVSLALDVKVNKIVVESEKFLYLDLNSKDYEQINYTIYPTNAQNKEVSYNVVPLEKEEGPMCDLEITKEGMIIPKSSGNAKIEVITADGGYKDSIFVEVVNSKLTSIKASVAREELFVGDKIKINVSILPTTATNQVFTYESSDNEIATIRNGQIHALRAGKATITVTSDEDKNIKDSFEITVVNTDIIDLPKKEITTGSDSGIIPLSINTDEEYELKVVLKDEYDGASDLVNLEIVDGKNPYIKFSKAHEVSGKFKVYITLIIGDIEKEVMCELNFTPDFEVKFNTDLFSLKNKEKKTLNFEVSLDNIDDFIFEVSVDNEFINAKIINESIIINALKVGVSNITLKATLDDISKEVSLKVVVLPNKINITEQASNIDLADMLVYASDQINFLNFALSDDYDESILEYIKVKVSNDNIDYTLDNLKLNIKPYNHDEIVTFEVLIALNEDNVISYSQIDIKFVANSKTVSNYNELITATKEKKVVVLDNDITDFPSYKDINLADEASLNKVSNKMHTTYDDTYYKNMNILDKAYVRTLVDFKNDVYGNGHIINAHNLTYGVDSTGRGYGIFNGPLHFVSASESQSSGASVKGQDNVCFAVYEGVKLEGVTLQACNDVSDLTYLENVGTTVEVFGDNVDITKSRIKNGRTVLRAFGDIDSADKDIHINITNSLLSNAREFIIRAGSNKFVNGEFDKDDNKVISPYIDGEIDLNQNKRNYNNKSLEEQQNYDNKYIKTYLTLSNVGLEKSGIFAIGLDAHFAGALLASAEQSGLYGDKLSFLNGWYDLAKTSYGVKLTLDETVRIYDWKKLSEVDSSTLIEVNPNFPFAEALKFDVAQLVKILAGKQNFKNILSNYQGEDYVHGGIAFFGGGRNYDVVKMTDNYYNKGNNFDLNNYEVSLNEAGAGMLEAAAGYEKFMFLLCDNTTSGFKPGDQSEILKDPNLAYKFLYQ